MNSRLSVLCLLLLLPGSAVLSLTSCQQPRAVVPEATEENAVGVAHLHERGFLEVMLRDSVAQPEKKAKGFAGPNGETYFRCYKGDPDYEMYLKQVGGLKKGESKLIPPFLGMGL